MAVSIQWYSPSWMTAASLPEPCLGLYSWSRGIGVAGSIDMRAGRNMEDMDLEAIEDMYLVARLTSPPGARL